MKIPGESHAGANPGLNIPGRDAGGGGDYAGPTTLAPERLDEIAALANSVFRVERRGDMAAEYPLLFHRERMSQLRIFTHAGRPVALVGVALHDLALLGCGVRAALIGSVCSQPEHRGHGLADRLMTDAIEHAREQGAVLMIISGGRGLYRRRGARTTGHLLQMTFPADSMPSAAGLTMEGVDESNVAEAQGMFAVEPVRYRRMPEDYLLVIRSGNAANSPGATWLVRRQTRSVGVVTAQTTSAQRPDSPLRIVEFAGSRAAVTAAAADLARKAARSAFEIEAQPDDASLRDLALLAGARVEAHPLRATVKLLDADRLWQAAAPLLRERIGTVADEIRIAGRMTGGNLAALELSLGQVRLEVAEEQAVLDLFFGAPESSPLAGKGGKLADCLRQALPLPLPDYGLNYA